MTDCYRTTRPEYGMADEALEMADQQVYLKGRVVRLGTALYFAILTLEYLRQDKVVEYLRAALYDEPASATERLPPDLAAALRDPTIVLPRDHEVRLADGRTLHEHLEDWRNAPSDTASADGPAKEYKVGDSYP